MPKTESSDKDMIERLDIIIGLLCEIATSQPSEARGSITERIGLLLELGLSPSDVGKVLGKETGYVTGVRSRLKKQGKLS